MALSRLRVLLRSYVLDYLDPLGEIRPNENLLTISSGSFGVKKAYVHNKALTMFVEETIWGEEVFFALENALGTHRKCFNGDLRFVHHEDPDHESYHQSKADFEENHTHILKGKRNPHPSLALKDIRCILDSIKEYEKVQGYCQDGQTQCLLSDSDQQKMLDGYEKYLRQKKNMPQLQAAVGKLSNELENRCIAGAKTFTQAFLTTFLERYIQPYLINKSHNPKKAKWSIEIIKSAITFSLNNSLLNTALDAIIRNGMKTGLGKIGMDSHLVDKIVTEIGSIIAFTQNPLSLLELGINGFAAAAGQSAAYQLIRVLPKLKHESAPAVIANDHLVEDKAKKPGPGMRHRGFHKN